MKLLHLLSTLDPRAGGPTEGVRQSGLDMTALGHHVEVASIDDPAAAWLGEFPLPVHALGPGKGFYGYTPKLVPWLAAHAQSYDAVIVNGLWQYHSYATWQALRRLDVPYYVFPHGMLDPWFKHTYPLKHLKKCLYWPWAEYRVLRDATRVVFTTQEECRLARQSFRLYRVHEEVVAFGTSRPPANAMALRESFYHAYPALRGKRLLLFLGRLHPKKGCDLLLKAFAAVSERDASTHVLMAGPDSSGWVPALKTLAHELGIAEHVTWTGMLQGDAKWGAFHASDAFVLPSHQENFGIAVAEALACGLPALISDKVNIWREVAADGAGFVAPDTGHGTLDSLTRWLRLDPVAATVMREQASQCFERHFTVDAMSSDLLRVLQQGRRDRDARQRSLALG